MREALTEQHNAGHTYYYHAETKKSTYTRPSADPVVPQQLEPAFAAPIASQPGGLPFTGFQNTCSTPINGANFSSDRNSHSSRNQRSHDNGRPEPKDRPKSKKAIPGASPWLLIYTKLGRRFVYNPEDNESFWKFPSDVLKAVVDLDRRERERRERRERGEPSESESEEPQTQSAKNEGHTVEDDDDEYEEVEVTDDEDGANAAKRPRIEDEERPGPVEFNEDDIAYQLASMGQDYEDGDDGNVSGDWEPEEEQLDPEDAQALFYDLLDDFRINPYTPWETIIEEGKIIEDDRYLCLPNMRSRKSAWQTWSHDRIQKIKDQRAKQEKADPRIPYLAFLQTNATPKLYWPEFKRKYRKEPEMRDTKVTDKDREKWYREHVNRLKLPESTLKSDLTTLLKSLPLQTLNRSTSLSMLPTSLVTDIRYISLRPTVRDPLIEAYIAMQPPAPDPEDAGDEADAVKSREDRQRREAAFKEREKRVEAERRQRDAELRASKGAMKAGEEELRRALQVNKGGLLGHLTDKGEQETTGAS